MSRRKRNARWYTLVVWRGAALSIAVMAWALAAAAAERQALVLKVQGSVFLVSPRKAAVTADLVLPRASRVDANNGSVTLHWPAPDARLTAEGVAVQELSAEDGVVRLEVAGGYLDLPDGHAASIRSAPEGGLRNVWVGAGDANPGVLFFGVCQTTVHIPAGAEASIVVDGRTVSVQGEKSTCEVVARDGRIRLLAGQRWVDSCFLLSDGILEPPEKRPPLTPFEP